MMLVSFLLTCAQIESCQQTGIAYRKLTATITSLTAPFDSILRGSTGLAARPCQNKAPSLTVGALPLRLASLNGRNPKRKRGGGPIFCDWVEF